MASAASALFIRSPRPAVILEKGRLCAWKAGRSGPVSRAIPVACVLMIGGQRKEGRGDGVFAQERHPCASGDLLTGAVVVWRWNRA